MSKSFLPIVFLLLLFSCKEKSQKMYNSTNKLIKYSGRFEKISDTKTALISSASSAEFTVKGDSVTIYVQSENTIRNYFVIAINDEYQKRYKLEGDSIQKITLKTPKKESNKIGIYKATEASSGNIIFHGFDAFDLISTDEKPFLIEFIGDSITCGALADNSDIDCNEGEYIDQHNAYLAYGPRLARTLNADFILSSVSGMGMYRNWNDENIEEPIMPQVYENLYLNTDSSKKYAFKTQPDVVSICLGTNDMSDGDGVKNRLPFNEEKYTENYINFVETIYSHYPNTKVVLLNSPMVSGDKNTTLVSCLKNVKDHFKDKEIKIFEFDELLVNGCNYHPSIQDHKVIATQLLPFFKQVLNQ